MLGVLGGTFDPIHCGHLKLAKEALEALHLSAVEFIPCNQPPHKNTPLACKEDRLEMVRLATQENSQFHANPLEINCGGISYTIDTLEALQPQGPLCLLLGWDAFLQFHSWHRWSEVLNYTHLILINRPNYSTDLPPLLKTLYEEHQTTDLKALTRKKHGLIYKLSIPPCSISATTVRESFKKGLLPKTELPMKVLEFIERKNLYR